MEILTFFKSIADETRIRLVNVLNCHELSVNEIVTLMAMGQSRISRHLKILTNAKILSCRRDGVWAFYSVAESGPGRRFVDAIAYLFETDAIFETDRKHSERIIEDRRTRSRQFFNAIAGEWEDLKQEILGAFDLNAAIRKLVPSCHTLADLGCGTGGLLARIKDRADLAVGIDSSTQMLVEASKRFSGGEVDLRLGDLEHLPVGNKEISVAVMSMVLHHLPDPSATIRDVFRILRPGGTFIIADYGKHSNESMRTVYGDRWLGFAREDMETWLASEGFTLVGVETVDLKAGLSLNIFSARRPETGGIMDSGA